jgi:hypothetical protein
MHWLDLYYVVGPPPQHAEAASPLHATDMILCVGLVGLFIAAILWAMSRAALIPERDPRLKEALSFENV